MDDEGLSAPPLSPGIEGEVSSPAQRLQPDLRHFLLLEEATYSWWHPLKGERPPSLYRLVLPSGLTHDFATVPRLLWALISPLDLGLASIFHDYLYGRGGGVVTLEWVAADGWRGREEPWSRRSADELFARIMREQGVPRWKRRLAYLAVRAFGRRRWRSSEGDPTPPLRTTGPGS